MKKFIDILKECCSDGGQCKCKQGKKCSGKCSCKKDIKEETIQEAKQTHCKQCGIKLSKMSKEEGFCLECATPINEAKKYKDDDDYGDWKMHQKKDDDLDKEDEKKKKKSKFEKYIEK